jgi:pimeloyl-ACP methyl ester carboxylesterase
MREAAYDGDRVRFAALEWEGTAPPVVLLHGACGNALWWSGLVPALAPHRVIALDLPGHGRTPPVDDWETERLAREVSDAVFGRHAGPVLLGGHSWGGKLAAVAAGLVPERVRGLVLVDPSPSRPVPVAPEDFVDAAMAGELGPWRDRPAAVAAVRELPQYRRWAPDLAAAFERGLEDRADGTVAARVRREWLLEIVAEVLTRDHGGLVGRVRCPTLLAIADESRIWQEPTNCAVLRDAELVVIAGNHWLHVDARDATAEAVTRFLGRL